MKKDTSINVSDSTHLPRQDSTESRQSLTNQYNLTYEETKKKEDTKNQALQELQDWKKEGNSNFGSAISDFFGIDTPDLFLTLTFRDKRIVSGINVGHRIDLEQEYDGYIPNYQTEFLKKDHSATVGVQRVSKAIDGFFYKGLYNFTERTKKTNNKIKGKPIYSLGLDKLSEKFVYVVELGDKGQRRHIHSLLKIKGEQGSDIWKLSILGIKKLIHLWERDQGFTDIKTINVVNAKDKYDYISKQQYIAKSFTDNQYENYSELFGSFDYKSELYDLRNKYINNKKIDWHGFGHGDVTKTRFKRKKNVKL